MLQPSSTVWRSTATLGGTLYLGLSSLFFVCYWSSITLLQRDTVACCRPFTISITQQTNLSGYIFPSKLLIPLVRFGINLSLLLRQLRATVLVDLGGRHVMSKFRCRSSEHERKKCVIQNTCTRAEWRNSVMLTTIMGSQIILNGKQSYNFWVAQILSKKASLKPMYDRKIRSR